MSFVPQAYANPTTPYYIPAGTPGAGGTLSLSGDVITLSNGGGSVNVATATAVALTTDKTTAMTYDAGLASTSFAGQIVNSDANGETRIQPGVIDVARSGADPEIRFSRSEIVGVGTFGFDGAQFVFNPPIPGGLGPTGPQGVQGPQGVIGPDGPAGATGPQGNAGATGPAGAEGATGPQGSAGTNGLDGATGPQGPQGLQGNQGIQGIDGPTGPQGLQGPAGSAGADGPTGAQGPAGSAGAVGATGPQGPQGLQGDQGLQGIDGPTGPQGIQGAVGSAGADGPTGAQGPAGSAGADGATGPQGIQGLQGNQGNQGIEGPTGPQGNAGADGASSSFYNYTAGTSSIAPPVANGFLLWNNATQADASGLYLSHLTNLNDDIDVFLSLLKTNDSIILQDQTNSANNQKWTISATPDVSENNFTFVPVTLVSSTHSFTNGDQLLVIVASAGAVGPTGAQGPQGNQGIAGATGPQGVEGPAGSAGADGATGPQGIAGSDGAVGATGPQGIQGLQGDQGIQGVAGATGPQGVEGPAGSVGADGATGPQGIAGSDGAVGATGSQGPQGIQGIQGNQGIDGPTGPQGVQGPAGSNGLDGPTGPQGPAGTNGLDGATGPAGAIGPTGIQGIQGIQGDLGPTGIQGIQGIQGPQGVQGNEGPTGAVGPAGGADTQVLFNAMGSATGSAELIYDYSVGTLVASANAGTILLDASNEIIEVRNTSDRFTELVPGVVTASDGANITMEMDSATGIFRINTGATVGQMAATTFDLQDASNSVNLNAVVPSMQISDSINFSAVGAGSVTVTLPPTADDQLTRKDYVDGVTGFSPSNMFYVAKNGSDISGNGSFLRPWLTLQYSITQIEATNPTSQTQAVLNVAPGHYTENLTFTTGYMALISPFNANDVNEVCEITGNVSVAITTGTNDKFNKQVMFQGIQITGTITDTSTIEHTVLIQDCYMFGPSRCLYQNSTVDCRTRIYNCEVNDSGNSLVPTDPLLHISRGDCYIERCDVGAGQPASALLIDLSGAVFASNTNFSCDSSYNDTVGTTGVKVVWARSSRASTFGNCTFVFGRAVARNNANGFWPFRYDSPTLGTVAGAGNSLGYCSFSFPSSGPSIAGSNGTGSGVNSAVIGFGACLAAPTGGSSIAGTLGVNKVPFSVVT